MLTSGKVARAFEIDREPAAVRDRYGRHAFRPVAAPGPAAGAGGGAGRPGQHGPRAELGHARRQLPAAQGRAAAAAGPGRRRPCSTTWRRAGLLDETLVMLLGEFGRTPKIGDAGATPARRAATTGRRASSGCSPAPASAAAR